MPYLFSKSFACFQTYGSDTCHEDISRHLDRYDEIIDEFLPDAEQLEAELSDIFADGDVRAMRYMRLVLFLTHVVKPGTRHKQNVLTQKDRIPYDFSRGAQPFLKMRLSNLIEGAEKEYKPRTAAQWANKALQTTYEPFPKVQNTVEILNEGIKQHPTSFTLTYMLALIKQSQGQVEIADQLFGSLTKGSFVTEPDTPYPLPFDNLHGSYWVEDARTRERAKGVTVPLYQEEEVWKAQAYCQRAYIAMNQIAALALTGDLDTLSSQLNLAKDLANKVIELFPYNDAALRILIRVYYGLYRLGEGQEYAQKMLDIYDIAKAMDGRIFNDFASLIYDVYVSQGKEAEAKALREKLNLFLSRVQLHRGLFFLYPETHHMTFKHNLPHGALERV